MNDELARLRHDIRGRLNAMKLAAWVLADLPLPDEEVHLFLTQIERAGAEMIELLDRYESMLGD